MSDGLLFGVPRRAWQWVVPAGVALGLVYVASPLTVWFAVATVALFLWAGRDVPPDERRWLFAILAVGVLSRMIVLGGLFLITNHQQQPFGSLFGDEEYFIKRSLWLRNIALRIPISGADFIYAYDEYSRTSYLWFLAVIHVLFGPSPYGVHLVSTILYLAGTLLLYRVVRPGFGRPASLLGLALLLFLPSLFAWSISALKEPLFFALMGATVAMVVTLVRSGSVWRRLAGGAFLVGACVVAQTIREGGLAMTALGIVGGLALAATIVRPRVLIAGVIALSILLPIVLTRGRVQDGVVTGVRQAAQAHWGHVNTPGYVYTFLNPRFYQHRSTIATMTFREGAEFVIGAFVTYVTVPTPGQIRSLAALSFLPEQMVWYALVALVPIGLLAGFRRDPLVSAVLLAFTLAAATLVALTSGNVGTLVRHRGLALPYVVWFSALGACHLLARLSRTSQDYR